MPLVRRIPKRGFHNQFALEVAIVNVGDLDRRFNAGEEVSPATLKTRGLVKGQYDLLKVLADGELTKSLKISAAPVQRGGQGKDRKGRRPNHRAAGQEAGGEGNQASAQEGGGANDRLSLAAPAARSDGSDRSVRCGLLG